MYVERSLHPFVLVYVHVASPFALLEINHSTTVKLAKVMLWALQEASRERAVGSGFEQGFIK